MISTRRITFGDVIREHRPILPRRRRPRRRRRPADLGRSSTPGPTGWPTRCVGAGVGPGDRILWLGQNSFRVYELLGAAAKIGAMVCPGYWRWAAPEMAFAHRGLRTRGWSSGRTRRSARPSPRPGPSWAQDTGRAGCSTTPRARAAYEAFLASGVRPRTRSSTSTPTRALLVIYTAAITGRQCGSMLSHRNLHRDGAERPRGWATSTTAPVPQLRADVPYRQLPVLGDARPSCTAARTSSCAASWPRNCCRCWPPSAAPTPT